MFMTNDHLKVENRYALASERLLFVMRASGLDTAALADQLGFSGPEELSRVAQLPGPMQPELAWSIHTYYPQIDIDWLLTGHAGEASTSL